MARSSAHKQEANGDPGELLTPNQLASEWHVSARTIVRYVAEGKLQGIKLPSGHIRIRRADADAAITEVGPEKASA